MLVIVAECVNVQKSLKTKQFRFQPEGSKQDGVRRTFLQFLMELTSIDQDRSSYDVSRVTIKERKRETMASAADENKCSRQTEGDCHLIYTQSQQFVVLSSCFDLPLRTSTMAPSDHKTIQLAVGNHHNEFTQPSREQFFLDEVPARVANIHFDGVGRTKEDILRKISGDLLKSTNFQDMIVNAQEVKGRLNNLNGYNGIGGRC